MSQIPMKDDGWMHWHLCYSRAMTSSVKLTASEKRFNAMAEIIDTVLPSDDGGTLVILHKPAHIAYMIRGLKSLGRTDRWQRAVETWAMMVDPPGGVVDDESSSRALRWAFLQYGIFTGHAAQ